MDRTVISYSDTTDNLTDVLVDEMCKNVYSDISKIYYESGIYERENLLYSLLKKYNDHYLVYYYLGYYYGKLNNYPVAAACYQLCISKYPLMDAFLNLGILYQQIGRLDLSKEVLNNAMIHKKNDLRILNFLGAIYYLEKDYYTAINHYKNILENTQIKNASIKNIYNNIGFSCSAIGKCKQALEYFENGLQIQCPNTNENIKLNVQLLQNKLINYDYMYDNPPNVFDEFLRINTLLQTNNKCIRAKTQTGKIKIGFISPDLRQHVCAYFMVSILKNYNRQLFTVFCYANVAHEDNVSNKFRNYPEIQWYNVFDMSTTETYNLITSHKIDILIDLAGHTNGNRLDVMSQKPAPIQMTYLGYPNSTGLISVDYRITDKYADPVDTKQKFSEKLIYLPRCFVCYSISVNLDTIPIKQHTHNYVTFGVMNKLNKHNKVTFKAWYNIIKRVPNSVLLIKRDMKTAFDIRIKYLKKLGLRDEQIKVINFISSQHEYYELYNNIDICLDTFPYSGTTTSCDAFQMSTPIITFAIPDRHVSNVTKSMLINMEYPELVANSIDEYIETAVSLANNPSKILFYKNNIRQKFIKLMDEKKFASEFDELMIKTFNNH